MCGIAGAIDTANSEGLVRAVEKMTAAMIHRGPDDGGIVDCGLRIGDLKPATDDRAKEVRVVLGARRLAILDCSAAGHQPMHAEDVGVTIAYNGETYNFGEIRAEIANEFGRWASKSDTEVVLRSYRRWGLGAFEKLRGMFAVAVWDAAKHELILARDRFGIKPLYYYAGISDFEFCNGELKSTIRNPQFAFLFASEVRALLASDKVPRKLSVSGVASYLNSGSIESPLTIVDGIRSLMPGHCLRVRVREDALQIDETPYTDPRALRSEDPLNKGMCRSRRDAVALVREKLEDSVRLHLVSDVPLGIFLSGGMDSSALVALMRQVTTEKPKTFSVVFDEKGFDEAPHSRFVARRFQTEHHEVPLSEDQLFDLLPAALGAMDQPTIDGVNSFVVSKAVKEAGVTVALSGLGGDELFAGYPSFSRALRLKNMSKFSRHLLRSASAISRAMPATSVTRNKFWELAKSANPTDVYQITRRLFSAEQVMSLLDKDSAIGGEGTPISDAWSASAVGSAVCDLRITNYEADTINQISQLEMTGYMANTLLRDTDSMSMAHSLEVRVPFVDIELVRLVLGLPGNWKLNGSRPKPLLADALLDLLPPEFLQRRKMGFTLPFEKWMQSRLRHDISSVLEDEVRGMKVGLDPAIAANVWRSFLRSPRAVGWSRPWALYVLSKWCEINGFTS